MSLTPSEQKAQLRRECLRLTAALTRADTQAADARITAALTALSEYRRADTLFCFVGIENEIDTTPFLRQVLADGKRLCVPLCMENGRMQARQIASLEVLKRGRYGLLEPPSFTKPVPANEIGFAVVPCLSADRHGNRLGRGGGYYDRYFGEHPALAAAVICRAALLRDILPTEPLDHRFSLVVTDTACIRV